MAGQETDDFYKDAVNYWSNIPDTIDGMLGGFARLSSSDVGQSMTFLKKIIQGPGALTEPEVALDCGAGIGRVSKRLLLPVFNTVDLVEVNPKFLKTAETYLGELSSKVGNYFPVGLQSFTPESGRYNVIWNQWVLGHLTDKDLVEYFKRCKKGLKENGVIVAKENVSGGEDYDFDEVDSSYTRPKEALLKLFEEAGLKVIREEKQKHFPKDVYAVFMFALQ
ncbi:DgyrCDS7940 [Dimorphilus gyrociliatus]|uniref:Alpha N-terminal protein methyltransferase 1 n=1 Tax=Dimorphilus gyrociliatus TaxID=2664684 RepID=A0A7I8VXK3_9ANNE|nr:DgyrCDS7940 [Dimorphilus gyrociliatus]